MLQLGATKKFYHTIIFSDINVFLYLHDLIQETTEFQMFIRHHLRYIEILKSSDPITSHSFIAQIFVEELLKSKALRLADVFSKGSDNKYIRLCGPHMLSVAYHSLFLRFFTPVLTL